ncbi:hypothetical protein QE363_003734 [Sphingomonas sp. SORGH_AS870]|uniref:hypothetical protein n=1 Tax=Sphingomonas sp. SORGH_AS_0870 TaxID=3041801 RepID=UPI00285D476E|nr:hypothetical protein [Sphingomonas sp. SORGH_AS_0870]MDR6147941.1 hypothetical protein [Sphingomonas sp. SORGH_AS_0870]
MTRRYAALAILDLAWVVLVMAFVPAGGAAVTIALLGHAALSLVTYAVWLRSDPHGGYAAAILGLGGPVGLMLGQGLGRMGERWATGSAWHDRLDRMFGARAVPARRRGAALEMARLLDGRVYHPAPERLDSLHGVLRHGPVAARRRALETVVRAFEPGLSPLVAQMLNDPDQTIRALAAAASARIVQNLIEQRAVLEARVAGGDSQAAVTLARLLAEHGRANRLLSDTQRQHLCADAARLLRAHGLGAEADALAIEAAWAAQDYAAIDRLHALACESDDDALWWRMEAAR